MRTTILLVVILGLISPAVVGIHSFGAQPSSNKVAVEEISIAELQAAYRSGRITTHTPVRNVISTKPFPENSIPQTTFLELTITLLTYFVTRSQTNSVSTTGWRSSAASTRNVNRSGP